MVLLAYNKGEWEYKRCFIFRVLKTQVHFVLCALYLLRSRSATLYLVATYQLIALCCVEMDAFTTLSSFFPSESEETTFVSQKSEETQTEFPLTDDNTGTANTSQCIIA